MIIMDDFLFQSLTRASDHSDSNMPCSPCLRTVFQSLTRASDHSDYAPTRRKIRWKSVPIPHSGKRSFRPRICRPRADDRHAVPIPHSGKRSFRHKASVSFADDNPSSNPSLGQAIIPTKGSSLDTIRGSHVPIPHSGKRSFRRKYTTSQVQELHGSNPSLGQAIIPTYHGLLNHSTDCCSNPSLGQAIIPTTAGRRRAARGFVPIPHSGKRSFRLL